jgi:hypothetical protein
MLDVSVGPDPKSMALQASPKLARLRDHLLTFYSPDHQVHFVTTSAGTGPRLVGSAIESLPLGDLDRSGRHTGTTLVVPRVKEPGDAIDFESPALAQAPGGEPRAARRSEG